jgi:hypothetical protein
MLPLNKVRGDRFSCCLSFGEWLRGKGAIAPLAFPSIHIFKISTLGLMIVTKEQYEPLQFLIKK